MSETCCREIKQLNVLLVGYDGPVERMIRESFKEKNIPLNFDHAQTEADWRKALKEKDYDMVITVAERPITLPEGPCDCGGHKDFSAGDPKNINGYDIGEIAYWQSKTTKQGKKPYVILAGRSPQESKALILNADAVVKDKLGLERVLRGLAENYTRKKTDKEVQEGVMQKYLVA